jgi:hypothetical protein
MDGCLLIYCKLVTHKILYVNFYLLKINVSVALQILITYYIIDIAISNLPQKGSMSLMLPRASCRACLLFDDYGTNLIHEFSFFFYSGV